MDNINTKNMSNNTLTICQYKNKILEGLIALENLKKIIVLNNKLARIILEETVAIKWKEIKKSNKEAEKMIPLLKKTLLWNIPHMKDFIIFVENNFDKKTVHSPCSYVDFLEKMLHRENISKNIRFLKYVLDDNIRCKRVFRKIN